MALEHSAFLTIVLLLVGAYITVRIRKQAGHQARMILVEYLGIVREFNDRHMTIQHQMGLVEDELVKRIHLIARRGMQIVDHLLAHGAITHAKHEEAYQFFRDCEQAHRRTETPRQLPDLTIDPCEDTHALKAEAEWHEFVHDVRLLRRHATETYESAFQEFFTEPGGVWHH